MASAREATVLITGSSDGLGRHVARDVAAGGATVLLHGRDRQRGEAALGELARETGNDRLALYLADLSSLGEVRRLADEVRRDHERLDVLVNNAGIGAGRRGEDERAVSRDGHELRFAVNYLAGFALTGLLLDLLRASAPARIVNVASAGQATIDFDDVMLEHGYSGMRAYGQSKLAQIMFTFEAARRLEGDGVTVNCLHPASLMDTRMVRESFGSPRSSVEEGARATLRLIAAPELEEVTGRYFDGQREGRADDQAYDAAARERLWALSEELVGRAGSP